MKLCIASFVYASQWCPETLEITSFPCGIRAQDGILGSSPSPRTSEKLRKSPDLQGFFRIRAEDRFSAGFRPTPPISGKTVHF
jgi:hypothetical protein